MKLPELHADQPVFVFLLCKLDVLRALAEFHRDQLPHLKRLAPA